MFDREVSLDAADIAPTLTWGTSPQDVPPDLPNIDTDRLIPPRFLKKPREAGLEGLVDPFDQER